MGGPLIFSTGEARQICSDLPAAARFIRPLYGSKEFISASPRACLWIERDDAEEAMKISVIASKVAAAAAARRAAHQDKAAQKLAETPYRFRDQVTASDHVFVVPRVSSENRPCLPVGLLRPDAIIQGKRRFGPTFCGWS
ncbi:type IIL restriction-modification enzyme MmeI [Rhodovulum sp. PH10]|uniref:type IIL restriction-modification enzyme MmeI n=1 Tax=Rhodovulum sp. PH10 TaxID=1187851 RepID=UPI00307A040D